MKYGTEIVSTSYYNGEVTKTAREVEESIVVTERAEVMKQILEGLELIHSGKTKELNIKVCVWPNGEIRIVKRFLT